MTNTPNTAAQAAPVVAASELSDDLPPLPEPTIEGSVVHPVHKICYRAPVHYTAGQMRDYARAVLAAATPAASVADERPGLERAAQYLEKQADDYLSEHASTEHDTGAIVWHFGEAGCSHHSMLGELAEEIRALAGAVPAAQQPAEGGWVSVDDERKPIGRTPILVAVSYVRYGEHEDGTPGEHHGTAVAEGEYVPQHGNAGNYFTCYSSPHGDAEKITHWQYLPAAPTQAEG
jgi:hypothetical protein